MKPINLTFEVDYGQADFETKVMMTQQQYEIFQLELNQAKNKRKRGRPSKKSKMLQAAPVIGKVSINLGVEKPPKSEISTN